MIKTYIMENKNLRTELIANGFIGESLVDELISDSKKGGLPDKLEKLGSQYDPNILINLLKDYVINKRKSKIIIYSIKVIIGLIPLALAHFNLVYAISFILLIIGFEKFVNLMFRKHEISLIKSLVNSTSNHDSTIVDLIRLDILDKFSDHISNKIESIEYDQVPVNFVETELIEFLKKEHGVILK